MSFNAALQVVHGILFIPSIPTFVQRARCNFGSLDEIEIVGNHLKI